jgi:type IV pilus assembly protein PilV
MTRYYKMHSRLKKRQGGATLLEVLVAVLILSFGLLGMSALQVRAIKGSISSFQRSQAVIYTQYIMDVMRVDRESAKGGNYNLALTCSVAAVTGTTLANNALRDWLGSVKQNIGASGDIDTCVVVDCNADYICKVRIQWNDEKAGGLSTQALEVSSRV